MLKRAPHYQALAHRRYYWGAPIVWTYINAALCSIPFFAGHLWIFAGVFVIGQYIVYLLCARDPERIRIYLKYIKQADVYRSDSHKKKYMKRPEGFGRSLPRHQPAPPYGY